MSQAFKRVYRAANRTEGYLLKGLLEQHGISVRLLGENLSSAMGELPADVIEVELQVPPGFEKLARELIADYERQDTGAASSAWQCANCGEESPASFAVCWNCSKPRPE